MKGTICCEEKCTACMACANACPKNAIGIRRRGPRSENRPVWHGRRCSRMHVQVKSSNGITLVPLDSRLMAERKIFINVDEGRITIFRSTLETLGWPSHYRFLYNPQMNQIAVQVCSAADAGAHRVGKLNEFSSCEIKCVAFVRMVYKNAQWDKRRSYRMIGNPFPEQRLVSFQIQEALPIENGRVLDGTVSPTFALCRAEGSPSQNNPTPEEKTNSGAV